MSSVINNKDYTMGVIITNINNYLRLLHETNVLLRELSGPEYFNQPDDGHNDRIKNLERRLSKQYTIFLWGWDDPALARLSHLSQYLRIHTRYLVEAANWLGKKGVNTTEFPFKTIADTDGCLVFAGFFDDVRFVLPLTP